MATPQTGLHLLRPLGGRSLHLRISPRPQNISQSRAILDQLKKFGQIEYYKNLKYERLPSPSSAIVIFKERDSADSLLQKSSINLTVEVPRRNSNIDLGIPTPPHSRDESPVQQHEFQIQINSSTYAHRDHINTNAYHAGFAIDSKSARQEDLAKRVPSMGLSDIDLRRREKPWRVMAWQRAREIKSRKPLRELYELGLREEKEREVKEAARQEREKHRLEAARRDEEAKERATFEAESQDGEVSDEGTAEGMNDARVMVEEVAESPTKENEIASKDSEERSGEDSNDMNKEPSGNEGRAVG